MGDLRSPATAALRAVRRTPFVSLLRTTPADTVCPNFYLLAHANGCSFRPGCEYCYLASSLWYLPRPRVFVNVDDLLEEVAAWIGTDLDEARVLNTGNLSDSLGFESERPLAARLVEVFRSEAEERGRPHTLLLVTKGGMQEVASLRETAPCRSVIVSFSLNHPEAAARYERGTPPVAERLAAARSLAETGWRIRLRIDPLIVGYCYRELAREVRSVGAERVTLGCLRAERGLLRRSRSPLFAQLEAPVDGRSLARYPAARRVAMYREAIEALGASCPVGLCEETAEMWVAAGLDPATPLCNCGE